MRVAAHFEQHHNTASYHRRGEQYGEELRSCHQLHQYRAGINVVLVCRSGRRAAEDPLWVARPCTRMPARADQVVADPPQASPGNAVYRRAHTGVRSWHHACCSHRCQTMQPRYAAATPPHLRHLHISQVCAGGGALRLPGGARRGCCAPQGSCGGPGVEVRGGGSAGGWRLLGAVAAKVDLGALPECHLSAFERGQQVTSSPPKPVPQGVCLEHSLVVGSTLPFVALKCRGLRGTRHDTHLPTFIRGRSHTHKLHTPPFSQLAQANHTPEVQYSA